jgi:hypothetical protein
MDVDEVCGVIAASAPTTTPIEARALDTVLQFTHATRRSDMSRQLSMRGQAGYAQALANSGLTPAEFGRQQLYGAGASDAEASAAAIKNVAQKQKNFLSGHTVPPTNRPANELMLLLIRFHRGEICAKDMPNSAALSTNELKLLQEFQQTHINQVIIERTCHKPSAALKKVLMVATGHVKNATVHDTEMKTKAHHKAFQAIHNYYRNLLKNEATLQIAQHKYKVRALTTPATGACAETNVLIRRRRRRRRRRPHPATHLPPLRSSTPARLRNRCVR